MLWLSLIRSIRYAVDRSLRALNLEFGDIVSTPERGFSYRWTSNPELQPTLIIGLNGPHGAEGIHNVQQCYNRVNY